MNYSLKAIQKLLKDTRSRKVSVKKALSKLKHLPYESFSFARIDHHRKFRKGFPEAIYAPGKSYDQLRRIIASFRKSKDLLVTRLEPEIFERLQQEFPELEYSSDGRAAYFKKKTSKKGGLIGIITAGTSDIPVAEEARITLDLIGRRTRIFYDCGMAGMHRLLDVLPELSKCRIVICIAGMDGVLPTAVGGLINRPVVAVPTSVGYGANFKGMAPLLTMLNTCSQGISVVNIDNGFGAACFAALCV